MIDIDRLIIVGTDGNLYEFLHGKGNTDGWKDCCFRDSSYACKAWNCSHEKCTRVRKVFGDPNRWSWRRL